MEKTSHIHVLEDTLLRWQHHTNWSIDYMQSLSESEGFFVETDKIIIKFIQNSRRNREPKWLWKKKRIKVGIFTLPNSKTYYRKGNQDSVVLEWV